MGNNELIMLSFITLVVLVLYHVFREKNTVPIKGELKRLENLHQVYHSEDSSLQDLLDLPLQEIMLVTQSEFGCLCLCNQLGEMSSVVTCPNFAECLFVQLDDAKLQVLLEGQPLVDNDWQISGLKRYAAVPISENGSIVAFVGLGNKQTKYTEEDILQTTQIMTTAYSVVDRKIEQIHLSQERETPKSLCL